MLPTLRPGDRVVVDTSDLLPTPPGLFLVWNGNGVQVMRVEHLPHSSPPTVELSYDNPKYPGSRQTFSPGLVQGRVVWHFRRA